MVVLLGRTTRVKSNFIPIDFAPSTTKSILQTVDVSLPQQSFTPIQQVRTRGIAGSHKLAERRASVSFTWITSAAEAEEKFSKYLQYFRGLTNGIAPSPIIEPNTFSFISSAKYSENGLNPVQFEVELTFLNAPDIHSEDFDPLEFFIDKTSETELSIKIPEDLAQDDLVVSRTFSVGIGGEFIYALDGYRDFKFQPSVLDESITSVDSDYIPVWRYESHILPQTKNESHSRSLGISGPRNYVTNMQANLKSDSTNLYVSLGWI